MFQERQQNVSTHWYWYAEIALDTNIHASGTKYITHKWLKWPLSFRIPISPPICYGQCHCLTLRARSHFRICSLSLICLVCIHPLRHNTKQHPSPQFLSLYNIGICFRMMESYPSLVYTPPLRHRYPRQNAKTPNNSSLLPSKTVANVLAWYFQSIYLCSVVLFVRFTPCVPIHVNK